MSKFQELFAQRPYLKTLIILIVALFLVGGVAGYYYFSQFVAIDNAQIYAPITSLSPTASGVLDQVRVQQNDVVGKGSVVAMINDQPLLARERGIITYVLNTPGEIVTSSTPVIKMYNPQNMELVGRIEENKGLSDIHPGQQVSFTVDAFSGKSYTAVVDYVSPAARQNDLTFSISDKRVEQEFDVHAHFVIMQYPELKPGMSAKMRVYK